MTLYIRAYADYSYEIIFLEGVVRKSRIHVLINPGKFVRLPGQADHDSEVEINIESLTHILAMETSIRIPKLINRTTYFAERTNKPIITNQDTANAFKEHGLSVKQLRIIGFEEEVIDGLHVDPIYLDELSDEVKVPEKREKFNLTKLVDQVNPINVFKKIGRTITKTVLPDTSSNEEIDTSKPLAFLIRLGDRITILLPLDKRGVLHINRILPNIEEVHTLIIPNQDVKYTKEIGEGIKNLLIVSGNHADDDVLIIPKSYNTGIPHDTLYGGLKEWIEIK